MIIQGLVHKVYDAQPIGEGSKRTVVIDEARAGDSYPRYLAVDFWNDRAGLLAEIKEGQLVTAEGTAKSRESRSKAGVWFTSINGTSIKAMRQASETPKAPASDDDEPLPF